jgi:hypothetical protein
MSGANEAKGLERIARRECPKGAKRLAQKKSLKNVIIFGKSQNCLIFAARLLCLFVWVFRALPSDKGGRVFFMLFFNYKGQK